MVTLEVVLLLHKTMREFNIKFFSYQILESALPNLTNFSVIINCNAKPYINTTTHNWKPTKSTHVETIRHTLVHYELI